MKPRPAVKKCRLYLHKQGNVTYATYKYRWSAGITCHFTLLCEVAESLVPVFKALLAEKGLAVTGAAVVKDFRRGMDGNTLTDIVTPATIEND